MQTRRPGQGPERTRIEQGSAAPRKHPPDEAEQKDQKDLLAGQNHILARIATGCTIPELLSSVLLYVRRFAPNWHCAIHLVDRESARLTNGMSKSLGRTLLRELERLPLADDWPLSAALMRETTIAPTPAPHSWSPSYLELERQYRVRCEWASPAVAPDGSTVAVIGLFREDDVPPASAPEPVLEIAASLLGVGVDRLRTVERLLLAQSSIDQSREPAICIRSDGSLLYVNEAAGRVFGYSRAELLEMRVWELDAKANEADFSRFWDLTRRRGSLKVRTEIERRDGGRVPVEVTATFVKVQSEGYQCALIRNISSEMEVWRRLQDCEARYAAAAKGANDGLWDWDVIRNEMHFSTRWCSLLGIESEELWTPSEQWWQRVHPDDRTRVRKELDAHLRGEREVFESEHRMIHAEGHYLWVMSRGEAVRDEQGEPTRVAGSMTDITKQKLAEDRLRHDAMHDDLTGLPNRTMFMEHLGRTLSRAQRSRKPFEFAVLFLDFDRFKRINDSLGHLVGDQLLVAIGKRLGSCVRPADMVSRLGGDEFSILLERVEGIPGATRVAERVHQSLKEPFRVSGLEVFITASIGIAIGSKSYERAEDVLRDADTAMYRAKAAGKARHEVFDERMHQRAIALLKLESELRLAVRRRELCLLYQPVISLADRALEGIEALARWRHPTRGLLPPSAFLGVAEESGLIVDIGGWVFRTACIQMKAWQQRFPKAASLSIHVNLSDKQLFQPELPGRIEAILAETGLAPESLVLDIPEHVIMQRAESAVTILGQLKSLRVRIHLDDFGTGYSSLGYLHRFQIETLKIDRSFIRHLRAEGDNWMTVRAIVSLAANLGMDVIAEGVESEEQLAELEKLNCRSAQGSYFHEPMTDTEVERLLAYDDA